MTPFQLVQQIGQNRVQDGKPVIAIQLVTTISLQIYVLMLVKRFVPDVSELHMYGHNMPRMDVAPSRKPRTGPSSSTYLFRFP